MVVEKDGVVGLYLSLATLHDDEFLLGGGPGEHNLCVVLQHLIHLILGQVLQVRAMDHTGFGIPETHTRFAQF